MSDNIIKPLLSPKLSETATLNPTDARMEVAPLSRASQGLTDINRNMNGTGNPTTGHFMGDALEWLKRATTPHKTQEGAGSRGAGPHPLTRGLWERDPAGKCACVVT